MVVEEFNLKKVTPPVRASKLMVWPTVDPLSERWIRLSAVTVDLNTPFAHDLMSLLLPMP